MAAAPPLPVGSTWPQAAHSACFKLDLAHTPENDAYDALQTVTATATPYRLSGRVVSGFGRGSKLLGCPTANLDPASFRDVLPRDLPRGVYLAWARVENGAVHKAVCSLGTNVSFSDSFNETLEAYILHDFPADFYGARLDLILLAFMRPMDKFESMDELMRAIARDIRVGDAALDKEPFAHYKNDPFFSRQINDDKSASEATAAGGTEAKP